MKDEWASCDERAPRDEDHSGKKITSGGRVPKKEEELRKEKHRGKYRGKST